MKIFIFRMFTLELVGWPFCQYWISTCCEAARLLKWPCPVTSSPMMLWCIYETFLLLCRDLQLTKEMVMEKPSAQLVGREFVRQYYTLLNQAPDYLHRYAHHVIPQQDALHHHHLSSHKSVHSSPQVLWKEFLLCAWRPGQQWQTSRGCLWTIGKFIQQIKALLSISLPHKHHMTNTSWRDRPHLQQFNLEWTRGFCPWW